MTALLPDPGMMTEVLRLADAADAARARGPAGPLVSCPADHDPRPELEEQGVLRRHLATLDDDQQRGSTRPTGSDATGRAASHYAKLYHQALATDLGEDGAGYLAGKDRIGECLWKGLEKLGHVHGQDR